MDKLEFANKIQAIGSATSDADRLELLAQLQEEAEKDYDRFTAIDNTNKQLSSDNEDLRSANMKLFKRIGVQKGTEKDDIDEDKNKKLKYEDLFDEKGGLK